MKYSKEEIKLLQDNENLNYEELQALLKKELKVERSLEGIRKKCKALGLKPTESVTFQEEEETPAFHVDAKDKVKWKYKHGVMEIDLESLDQIFYEYSKHGLNLSQTKIQNKHGLTAIQWQSLKRTFDLVKDSDVFSFIQLERHDGETQCKMIADKIAQKYSPKNMRDVIEYEDNKQRQKAYEKSIKKVSQLEFRRQVFESELLDYVAEAKAVTVKRTKGKGKIKEALAHVCDLHIGADIIAAANLPEFNIQIVIDRLAEVARLINEEGAEKLTLAINGDIIETFTGMNHPNSWQNIDRNYGYGVKATIKASEILTDFISQINNVHEVLIVAGNHDRVTSSNKEDVDGEVVQWIHHILQGRFGHLFNVEWSSDVITRVIGGVNYIITHGHHALAKKPTAEIVNQYGKFGMFNVVLRAHLHTRIIAHDSLNYRNIVAPSIFTGNPYSKNLGFTTLAGFLFCYSLGEYPIITDYPLA